MFTPLLPYKNIFIALVIAAIAAGAYYKGYSHEHEKLLTFRAQVAQKAADQNAAAKQKDEENAKQVQDVANAYVGYYNRLVAGLRKQQVVGGSGLPAGSSSTTSPDGAEQELSGACKGTEFYRNALEDVLKLQMWQERALRLHLPIQGE